MRHPAFFHHDDAAGRLAGLGAARHRALRLRLLLQRLLLQLLERVLRPDALFFGQLRVPRLWQQLLRQQRLLWQHAVQHFEHLLQVHRRHLHGLERVLRLGLLHGRCLLQPIWLQLLLFFRVLRQPAVQLGHLRRALQEPGRQLHGLDRVLRLGVLPQ